MEPKKQKEGLGSPWAASVPSKPYALPNDCQAAYTPGVLSMRVLQRDVYAQASNTKTVPVVVKENLERQRM